MSEKEDKRTVRLLSQKLVELRKNKGLTQERLHECIKNEVFSLRTIKRAEKGEPIFLKAAQAIANALQVPLDELRERTQGTEENGNAFDEFLQTLFETTFTTSLSQRDSQVLIDGWFCVFRTALGSNYGKETTPSELLSSKAATDDSFAEEIESCRELLQAIIARATEISQRTAKSLLETVFSGLLISFEKRFEEICNTQLSTRYIQAK